MRLMKKTVYTSLALLMMTVCATSGAAAYPEVVIDSDSGIVLYQAHANQS